MARPRKVLHQLHPADDVIERFSGVGDRQQIVQVLAVHAGPAQMVRNPFRLDPPGEVFQALQIFEIGRGGGGDRQRYAMHHDGIAFADPVERAQRLAARHHVVFADDLEPVDRRIAVEDFVVVLVRAGRDRSRGTAAWPIASGGLQAPSPTSLAICLRRSCRLRLNAYRHIDRRGPELAIKLSRK